MLLERRVQSRNLMLRPSCAHAQTQENSQEKDISVASRGLAGGPLLGGVASLPYDGGRHGLNIASGAIALQECCQQSDSSGSAEVD